MYKSRFKYLIYPIVLLTLFSYFPQNSKTNQESETSVQIYTKNDEFIEPYCESFNKEYFQNQNYQYITNLEIEITESENWNQNLFEAFVYEGTKIKDQFKKNFKSKLKFNFSDESYCKFDARIRISGDWKDHLKIKNGTIISSLDVRLTEGNIFGITEFKLFIPETRKSDNEIFTASLFSELGFLSPRTFYIDSQLNKTFNQKYIFQEKFRKEMVEFNGYREGPLIQVNDKTQWENELVILDSNAKAVLFGYITNETWLERSKENIIIGNNSLYGINEIINSIEGSLYYPTITNFQEVASFDAAIFASSSNHAYNPINRKFLYDPLNNYYIPVYYDGNSEVLYKNNTFELTKDYANDLLAIGARNLLKNKRIDVSKFTEILNIRGLSLDNNEVEYYLKRFYKNLEEISKISELNPTQSLKKLESNKKYKDIYEYLSVTYSLYDNFITLDNIDSNFKICNDKLNDCNNLISINEFTNPENSINDYKFIPSTEIITENISKENLYKGVEIININNTEITIDKSLKKIVLNFNGPNQRVVLQGEQQVEATLDTWTITANSTGLYSVPSNDIFGLTGCINFINLELKNISISTKDLSCEDSVNIIRSSGQIKNIYINKSVSDGLDIDFSQIFIDKVEVINSGNDCLDLSYGEYKFSNVVSENCDDKGVSIGESSNVVIENLQINNTKTGLVVKDSSIVLVKNIEVNNSETCYSFYRKKQEFIQPIIEFNNYFCDKDSLFIQPGVEFEN
jgi:hypothetical protein